MPLLYEKHDHVGILTLSRPEARNAWHQEFATGSQEQLPELEEDRDIRCVILTGDDTGGAFSAGADLKNPRTHTQNSIADFIEGLPHRRRSSPIVQVADFAKPVVAALKRLEQCPPVCAERPSGLPAVQTPSRRTTDQPRYGGCAVRRPES